MLNYRHLYYFWVVTKAGGFARAAERLDMAVQTISAQVRELEKSLGHQLLKPAGRGVAMTEAGHAAALSTLREVVPLSETTRNDITLRVLLAVEVESLHDAATVVDTHRLALISQLQTARQHVRGRELTLLERLALEADLVSIEGLLRWLDICDDEMKGPR